MHHKVIIKLSDVYSNLFNYDSSRNFETENRCSFFSHTFHLRCCPVQPQFPPVGRPVVPLEQSALLKGLLIEVNQGGRSVLTFANHNHMFPADQPVQSCDSLVKMLRSYLVTLNHKYEMQAGKQQSHPCFQEAGSFLY